LLVRAILRWLVGRRAGPQGARRTP
jgi:hypothetical protein